MTVLQTITEDTKFYPDLYDILNQNFADLKNNKIEITWIVNDLWTNSAFVIQTVADEQYKSILTDYF